MRPRPDDWHRDGHYVVSTDPRRLDFSTIHGFLKTAYWCEGISEDVVRRAFANSLAFGVYTKEGKQAGGARVVTDFATFAYVADVFVLPAHRGRGLATLLMAAIASHPDLQGLRRWLLATRDAHGLYRRFGFAALPDVTIFMERHDPDIYQRE